jgi:hypothetical protein
MDHPVKPGDDGAWMIVAWMMEVWLTAVSAAVGLR